ncbi:hypothetical protein [Peribacillus sp. AS_2]|uniref:hypothetical protein n=1 Tax=Peribacillus sp. AS_2 TaxID=2996755 RepID=UPI0022A67D44|nr:hypothetical protein [Peribacillus sp. AS_2]MCZ0872753.1 hypothetical protein [Peribacillus sp. AS_2]
MKLIEEILTFEYETKAERREHRVEMERQGYKILEENITLDLTGHEHILCKYTIKREGYKGSPLSEGSIK